MQCASIIHAHIHVRAQAIAHASSNTVQIHVFFFSGEAVLVVAPSVIVKQYELKPVSESVALQGQLKRVEFDGLEVGTDEFRLRLQAFGFLNLNAGFH